MFDGYWKYLTIKGLNPGPLNAQLIRFEFDGVGLVANYFTA